MPSLAPDPGSMNPAPVRQCEEGKERQGEAAARRGARELRARGIGDREPRAGPRQGLAHLRGTEDLGLGVSQPAEEMCVRDKGQFTETAQSPSVCAHSCKVSCRPAGQLCGSRHPATGPTPSCGPASLLSSPLPAASLPPYPFLLPPSLPTRSFLPLPSCPPPSLPVSSLPPSSPPPSALVHSQTPMALPTQP